MPTISFTTDDVKFMEEFGAFIHKHMHLQDVTVPECLAFNKLLVQYNALYKKVNDHILEISRVIEAQPEPKKKGK